METSYVITTDQNVDNNEVMERNPQDGDGVLETLEERIRREVSGTEPSEQWPLHTLI